MTARIFDTTEGRRRIMRAIRSKNTRPEMHIRRALHGLGYRYTVHQKGLPGSPDLAFSAKKKAVFVHGCFWHGHELTSCPTSKTPKRNADYWVPKLLRNKERDAENIRALRTAGWDVLVVWECELKDFEQVLSRIRTFLGPKSTTRPV